MFPHARARARGHARMCRCGPLEPAIALLADGLDVKKYVTEVFDLKDAEKAIERGAFIVMDYTVVAYS